MHTAILLIVLLTVGLQELSGRHCRALRTVNEYRTQNPNNRGEVVRRFYSWVAGLR